MARYKIKHTEPKCSIDGKDHYRVLYLAPKNEWIMGYKTWRDAIGKSFDTLEEAQRALEEVKRNG